METQYFKHYSPSLNRDMECKIYGHAGRPVLFIPCQDGRYFDFENFKMTDVFAPWIESGQVMVCAIDTIILKPGLTDMVTDAEKQNATKHGSVTSLTKWCHSSETM